MVFALSTWLEYASVETCESDQYQVWEEEYGHFADHLFGTVLNTSSTWGSFSATGDEGAITYPQRAFVKLTEGTTLTTAISITLTVTALPH